jgi:hypothetical protein
LACELSQTHNLLALRQPQNDTGGTERPTGCGVQGILKVTLSFRIRRTGLDDNLQKTPQGGGLASRGGTMNGAQSITWQTQTDLLSIQSSVSQFCQTQAELERYKERERLNVPVYGSDLAKVVAEFQKHIADMHFRHVTCKICKDQVKRIRQLAKSIEEAMK